MPEPRRVVIATTDFLPMIGGVADHLHRVAEALTDCADVTVATSVPDRGRTWSHAYRLRALPPLPERRLGDRIGDGVPLVRKLQTGAHFLSLRRYARDFVERVRDEQPGAELLVGIWDVASHFWCEACRKAGVEYSLLAYGVELLIPLYGRLPTWRRDDFAGAARVLAISRSTADLIVSRMGVAAAPHIVHPIAGDPPEASAVERRMCELRQATGGSPVLLSVGRLVRRKGFDTVIQSVAGLQRELPGVRYLILGDGPEREALAARARALGVEAQVTMLGPADEATKWAAYGMCDLFVMPNRDLGGADWEGFGIVFAEAARAGRPVVAGRSGGVSDAVVDGETGVLVDPDDPAALTSVLRMLLTDSDRRHAMGSAAREMAARRFTPAALRAQLVAGLGWTN